MAPRQEKLWLHAKTKCITSGSLPHAKISLRNQSEWATYDSCITVIKQASHQLQHHIHMQLEIYVIIDSTVTSCQNCLSEHLQREHFVLPQELLKSSDIKKEKKIVPS